MNAKLRELPLVERMEGNGARALIQLDALSTGACPGHPGHVNIGLDTARNLHEIGP